MKLLACFTFRECQRLAFYTASRVKFGQ